MKENKTDNCKRIIAVDFDGCLFVTEYPTIYEPIMETVSAVRKEHDAGSIIILWTCRSGEHLDAAVRACEHYGIPIDYVNENCPEILEKFGDSRKIFATEYWDDRGRCYAKQIDSPCNPDTPCEKCNQHYTCESVAESTAKGECIKRAVEKRFKAEQTEPQMLAVDYLRSVEQICNSYEDCLKCPLNIKNKNGFHIICKAVGYGNPEQTVRTVQRWANEHRGEQK